MADLTCTCFCAGNCWVCKPGYVRIEIQVRALRLPEEDSLCLRLCTCGASVNLRLPHSAESKDVAGKAEAVLEASSLLLPHAAEGMKEHLLQATFLGGVAGSTMGALFQAGRSVPIFGEVS